MINYRWTIEICFRFFKRTLGHGHLFCENPKGILLETSRVILACVRIHQATGRKPTRQTVEMHTLGWAELDEVTSHLEQQAAREAAAQKQKKRLHRPLLGWGRVAVDAAR